MGRNLADVANLKKSEIWFLGSSKLENTAVAERGIYGFRAERKGCHSNWLRSNYR